MIKGGFEQKMLKKLKKVKFGTWAFMIGIVGAILLGLLAGLGVFSAGTGLTVLLVVAGLVIGFSNITVKEAVPVMVAALVLGGGAGILASLPLIGGVVEAILASLAKVALPAGIVIAVKTIWEKAR